MKKSELIHKLGKRIANLRKEKKLSQEEFADISGKMINTLSNIECGLSDPKVSTLEAIAQALGTSVSILFSDAQNLPTIQSSTMLKIFKLLENEDEKILKTVQKQIEALLTIKE